MSVVIGALSSLIGYLGAAAATETFFERLLWPERFYNDVHPYVLLRLAFFLPMAGPLHGAALDCLSTFRDHGLYLGIRRGKMLGTMFYQDTETKYRQRTDEQRNEKEVKQDARNGFWVQVLREVKCHRHAANLTLVERGEMAEWTPPFRAMQFLHHLRLRYSRSRPDGAIPIEEFNVTWRTFLGTLISEVSSIAVAITAAVVEPFRTYWLAGYLLIPLALKLLALLVRVQREPIVKGRAESESVLYQIQDPTYGFAIIDGVPSVVLQFFQHYGHPKRDSGVGGRRDRTRELLSMALIYLFLLYFPAGLIGSVWMPSNTQLLWLGFEAYTIVMMHVVRIVGWDNCGRTEARVARYLEQKKLVFLRRADGEGIVASLETRVFPSIRSARREVNIIVKQKCRDG
ncbi:hypothetical protein A1O3_05087 [Capronia epimyces CBS 606.96]|uniref:Uncharacterized protein n=1 Tax=Capronia epimyces CBS 606.96 TaxID=1182542 RepID=W9Y468_9EURO|nr:uncharacterized protein A1O3_05087 [Capronia epimyces CBS 606.96]EXJ84420.1 hypothetical protein A1O3_05087 [Capronia epimyces CBS 606.96]